MSWEALTAIASLITAVVIAVTAVVAVIQIRHLRTANQLTAALSLYHEIDDPLFERANTFVSVELEEHMRNPAFREALRDGKFDRTLHQEIRVGNYWEKFGLLLRKGLLDKELFLDWGSPSCLAAWKRLRDVTRLIRLSTPEVWRDFEYIARLSADHIDSIYRHPLAQPKWREGLEEMDIRRDPPA